MSIGRSVAIVAALAGLATAGCDRGKPSDAQDIAPSFSISRTRVPLGSAVEVTYTWKTGPGFQKLDKEYRAFVHFLDSHRVMLFEDDHVPSPPPTEWQPNQTYTYRRTKFIPIYPYIGDVEVRMGLSPPSGRGERLALQGEHAGLREYTVAKVELTPQTDNIFLVHKSGWHSPEAFPDNPSLERTWTEKQAIASFKNPRRDVVLYLEADTNLEGYEETPVLTVSVNGNGLRVPIETSEVFLKKVRFAADQLGSEDWVDLTFTMNDSFIPKELGMNDDYRELGLLVYHMYVGDLAEIGDDIGEVEDAAPLE